MTEYSSIVDFMIRGCNITLINYMDVHSFLSCPLTDTCMATGSYMCDLREWGTGCTTHSYKYIIIHIIV